MCVLDGGQQQCVNPGHPRVSLSHSAIHCCLAFLPASFLPSCPSASSSFSFSFLNTAQTFQIRAPPPGSSPSSSCSAPPRENKNRLKNSHHLLLSELLTMQIPSLSSLFPLAPFPSLSLSATVREELSHFLSFSSPSLALPLILIVI